MHLLWARCIDCPLIQQVPSIDPLYLKKISDITGASSFPKFQTVTPLYISYFYGDEVSHEVSTLLLTQTITLTMTTLQRVRTLQE